MYVMNRTIFLIVVSAAALALSSATLDAQTLSSVKDRDFFIEKGKIYESGGQPSTWEMLGYKLQDTPSYALYCEGYVDYMKADRYLKIGKPLMSMGGILAGAGAVFGGITWLWVDNMNNDNPDNMAVIFPILGYGTAVCGAVVAALGAAVCVPGWILRKRGIDKMGESLDRYYYGTYDNTVALNVGFTPRGLGLTISF